MPPTIGGSIRTRFAQEALLLVSLAFLFFAWPVLGVFVAVMVNGGRLELSLFVIPLTLPAWPLWLLHGASIALTGISLFTIYFPTGVPILELTAVCAVVDALLLGLPVILYLRRHAW